VREPVKIAHENTKQLKIPIRISNCVHGNGDVWITEQYIYIYIYLYCAWFLFKSFTLASLFSSGVGAMELVAMDMKVSFNIFFSFARNKLLTN
jgi:hypothetical protein